MASAWSQLDQLLTCAICLDRYRNPKLLPCQHTFCMEPCLDGLIDYARRQIKCPECRAEHRIPYKGIQEFPTNVTLMRFLELHRDITGEEPEPPPSMMERCNVCSEKSNLERCAHCDKKICPDCKEAHVDILRREINRINNQVRRGLHRLSEALTQTKKNAEKLQINCDQVKEEIEDIVRRYSKDLKHTEEKLKHDLEMYTETELKAINKLKEDLEAEVSNMSSNCDLVDKYIKDDNEWSDIELLEYKEIFIKTLDFLRTFDSDNADFARRIKFQPRADPDVLHRNIADFGELKINAPPSAIPTQQSLMPPPSNALMRSQSDHRLAAQFARRSDTRSFTDRYSGHTSDNEREGGRPTSPLFGRGSRRDNETGYRRYTDRSRDYDYQERSSSRYLRDDNTSGGGILSSRWRDNDDYGHRSRYNREYDDCDSEVQHTSSRTVRFADEQPQRERVFDTSSATKGPLSGVVRLMDSPKVMERLHQNEVRQKQNLTEKETPNSEVKTSTQSEPIVQTTPAPQTVTRKPPTRQQSEDDIDRQKKANQQASTSNTSTVPQTATPAPEATSRSPLRKGVTEVSRAPVPERKDTTVKTTSENISPVERQDTTQTRVRKPQSIQENAQESEVSTPENTTVQPRYSHQPLGKTLPLNSEANNTKTVLDKKVLFSPQTTQKTTPTNKSQEEEEEEESEEEESEEDEEAPKPVQSSFFSRQRRLPDPEPRLLMGDDDDEEEEEEEDSDDEEEDESEEEAEEDLEQGTVAKQITRVTEDVKQDSENKNQNESENEDDDDSGSSSSSSSSSESESEDSEASEEGDQSTENNIKDKESTLNCKSNNNDSKPSTVLSSAVNDLARYGNEPDIIQQTARRISYNEDDDEPNENIADLVKNIDSPFSSVRRRFSTGSDANSSDINRRKSRRRSDDTDTTESSGSSSTNHQNLECNNTSILSNGNGNAVDEAASSESSSTASTTASDNQNEIRYPSTNRRRPFLARSKSSHELGLGYDATADLDEDEQDQESPPTYRSRLDRMSEGNNFLPRTRSNYASSKRDQNSVDNTSALSANSNNSWANYLKNKYGSNAASKVIPRSRSSHSLYQRSDSDTSDDDTSSGKDPILSGSSYGFSNPRSTYMQKRRMMFKIGSRGTEPGNFTWPRGIAVGPENSVVVADSSNHRVQVFDAMGKFSHEFGTYGSGPGEFDCLAGVAVNRIGQYIVSDRYNHRIQLFDPSGRFLRAFGCEGRTDGRFNYPWGLTTDSLGFIYVCDKENHRIQVFQSDGTFVGKFGSLGSRPGQLEHPHYIAVSNTNRVVVSDSNNHRIQIFDVNGRTLSTFGSEGSGEGQFKFPRGVAVDDQGFIIVGDSGNNRIQIFHPDGNFLRGFGSWGAGEGEFKGLEGIAVTSTGNIVVCDRENHRIQVF